MGEKLRARWSISPPDEEGRALMRYLALGLLVVALAGLVSGVEADGEAFSYVDTISQDDFIFYELDVNSTDDNLIVLVQWEDEYDWLNLYMTDPSGALIAQGNEEYYGATWINITPASTGVYSIGIEGWSVYARMQFLVNASHPMRKITFPFGGSIAQGEVVARRIEVDTIRRPLFVRLHWDNWQDDVNISLFGPGGDRLDTPDDYWGSETSLYLLYWIDEVGTYTIEIKGLKVETSGNVTYTAATNFPISEEVQVPEDGEEGLAWFVIPTLVGLAVAIFIAGFLVARVRSRRGEGIYIIEEVFVVRSDGRLMYSRSRGAEGTPDADLMSGMLIAIQGFIQDGLRSGGMLESIKYGESEILIASGNRIVLAARVSGDPMERIHDVLRTTVRSIEATHQTEIDSWTGETGAFLGLDDIVDPLIATTAHVSYEDIPEDERGPEG